jgi:hypothetical protein
VPASVVSEFWLQTGFRIEDDVPVTPSGSETFGPFRKSLT